MLMKDAAVAVVDLVESQRKRTTRIRDKLMRLHYRLGHIGFHKIRIMLERKAFLQNTIENINGMKSYFRNSGVPFCLVCHMVKMRLPREPSISLITFPMPLEC